jgi:tetratricopeptide (TPR) repeat protein
MNGGIMGIKEYLSTLLVVGMIIGCAPNQTQGPTETGVDKREKAQQEYSIGYEYMKHGKYEDAIIHFKESIKLDHNFYAAYIALGQAYRANRDIVNAQNTYNQAKKINPKDPRSYEGLGALFVELKQYGEAIGEYEGGLKVDSTNLGLLNGLGYVYTKTREYDRALSYYFKSLEYEPDDIETMFAIANVYKEKGEPNNAVSYLESVRDKKPELTQVRKKLAETYYDLGRYDDAAQEYLFLITSNWAWPTSARRNTPTPGRSMKRQRILPQAMQFRSFRWPI